MIEPCPFVSPCPNPDYLNLSVEAPDGVFSSDFFFWGFYWGSPQDDPPLGSDWQNWTALATTQSPTSQPDADAQAAVNQPILLLAGGSTLGTSPVGGHPVVVHHPPNPPHVWHGSIAGFSGYSCVNAPYAFVLTATGFNSPFSFKLSSGTLPPGLTLDPAGVISGTPTTAGHFTFAVNVVDAASQSIFKSMTFEVLGINTSSVLPAATVGTAYSQALDAGGVAADFFITAGALPAGLTLGQFDGVISGTPTIAAPTTFTVSVRDVFTNTCSKDFSLIVNPPPNLWAGLVWGAFHDTCTPASPYAPPTGNFAGANFSIAAHGGTDACDDPAGPSVASCDGTLTYTGPAKACNLHLVANPVSADPGSAQIMVEVVQQGTTILSHTIHAGSGGTFDFPFTIADTAGSPNTIAVLVTWKAGQFTGFTGSLTGNGILS